MHSKILRFNSFGSLYQRLLYLRKQDRFSIAWIIGRMKKLLESVYVRKLLSDEPYLKFLLCAIKLDIPGQDKSLDWAETTSIPCLSYLWTILDLIVVGACFSVAHWSSHMLSSPQYQNYQAVAYTGRHKFSTNRG
jgi:hypothetical protein